MNIKDKIIIITGASKGIGLATAKYLAGKGAKVVLAARSEDILKSVVKDFPNASMTVTDMTDVVSVKKMISMTIKKHGRIDILINNAGQGMYQSIENINIEEFKSIMDLNLYSVLRAMQLVIPIMRSQKEGMIINVSSGVTKMYIPNLAAYSATKYALNAISLIARQELSKDKIIVSVIEPRMTTTDFYKNALGTKPNWPPSNGILADTPEQVAVQIGILIESEQDELRM